MSKELEAARALVKMLERSRKAFATHERRNAKCRRKNYGKHGTGHDGDKFPCRKRLKEVEKLSQHMNDETQNAVEKITEITDDDITWVISKACQKPKDYGYSAEF